MKILIRDGSKDGMFYAGFEIRPLEEGEAPPPYHRVADVTPEEWKLWLAFIEEHNRWEGRWDDLHETGTKVRP